MGELPFIICLVGGFLGLAVVSGIKKRWWNMAFWIFIGAGLGGFEIASKIATGHSISQNHWDMTTESGWVGWTLTISSAVLFLSVWVHLAWKWMRQLWKKRGDGT